MADPREIAALIELLSKPVAGGGEYGMPYMPPLPRKQAELRNIGSRPSSATAQVEKALADVLLSAPAAGYEGGQMIGEGIKHGSPGDVAAGTGTLALGMIGGVGAKRRPLPTQRFGDADTSHIGMLPWMTAPAGGVAGGYAGSQLDDKDSNAGALLGTLLGGAAGFGAGVVPVLRHIERRERAGVGPDDWGGPDPAWEAKLAAARARYNQPPGPAAAQPTTKAEPPMTLSRRLREYETFMPPPRQSLSPDDLAGPTGSRGTIKNAKGEEVYQTQHGWKNRKTNAFTDPPDKDAMTSGFSDADLAAARKK